jgi:hypothetical protein
MFFVLIMVQQSMAALLGAAPEEKRFPSGLNQCLVC